MKKSIVSLVIAASIFTSASAYAISFEQAGDKTVRLYGNAEVNEERVALDVFVNGKSRADLEELKESGGNYLDIWVTHLQTTSNENGDYEFEFDIALPSGKYTAYTGIKDKEFEPYTFVFVSNSDFAALAEEINSASVDRITQIIKDKNECYVIGVSEEEAAAIDAAGFAKVLQKTLSLTPFNKDDRDASWIIADKAYFVQQLNENKIADIYKVDKNITEIADSDIKDWYGKENVSGALIADYTKRMNGRGFADYDEYKKAMLEAFILATVKNPSGVSDVENILTEFKDKIGINVTSSTPSAVWNKLSGKDYSNYKALAAAFDGYVKEGNGIGSSSSGNSSSGPSRSPSSSSGSKSVAGKSTIPAVENKAQDAVISTNIFDDIHEAEWAKDAIVALAEKNIVSGVGNNCFNPNGKVTREQFARIVVGAFVPEAEKGDISFDDVESSAWYAEDIAKAYEKGIVSGMGDGSFGVGKNITRQDMCVMIYKAAKAAGMDFAVSEDEFADDSTIADYAKEAVYALRKTGAVNGINDKEFGPLEFATRAQAAQIIYSLIK